MKRVLIIQEVMKHYRLPFYEALYEELHKQNTVLTVLYSDPTGPDTLKSDNIELPSRYGRKVPVTKLLNGKIVYQHCLMEAVKYDIVIVEQANKHILNYLLLILKPFTRKRLAFWGHGKNFRRKAGLADLLKRLVITVPDWWFAYTQLSVNYLKTCGVDESRISNVQNSIDTESFRSLCTQVSSEEMSAFRAQYQIPGSAVIGLYCGSLYKEKQIDFLLQSARLIKSGCHDFHMLFIGAGPDSGKVDKFCRDNAWAAYLGPVFGELKALAFSSSSLILNPGLVGLGILDAFAAGKPMVTTNYPHHSPEIAYLDDNNNGVISDFDVSQYANCVIGLLRDRDELARLGRNGLALSSRFSTRIMADNFSRGIIEALRQQ